LDDAYPRGGTCRPPRRRARAPISERFAPFRASHPLPPAPLTHTAGLRRRRALSGLPTRRAIAVDCDLIMIFICYARHDVGFALQVEADLRAAGKTVWIDRTGINAGESWDQVVETALARSADIVVVLSPAAVTSRHVLDELSYALDENKRIIPLLYQACRVPLRIRRLQYIDFTLSYDQALATLLAQLMSAAPSESSPVVAADMRAPIAIETRTVFQEAAGKPPPRSSSFPSADWLPPTREVLVPGATLSARPLGLHAINLGKFPTIATIIVVGIGLGSVFVREAATPYRGSHNWTLLVLLAAFVATVTVAARGFVNMSVLSWLLVAYSGTAIGFPNNWRAVDTLLIALPFASLIGAFIITFNLKRLRRHPNRAKV
jgi:hypothetical protein